MQLIQPQFKRSRSLHQRKSRAQLAWQPEKLKNKKKHADLGRWYFSLFAPNGF
jgi:hypothetical protein